MVDHPGFHDEEYKKRRNEIANKALGYRIEDPEIPRIIYTDEEIGVWNYCFTRLTELYKENACKSAREAFYHMEQQCGYGLGNIP